MKTINSLYMLGFVVFVAVIVLGFAIHRSSAMKSGNRWSIEFDRVGAEMDNPMQDISTNSVGIPDLSNSRRFVIDDGEEDEDDDIATATGCSPQESNLTSQVIPADIAKHVDIELGPMQRGPMQAILSPMLDYPQSREFVETSESSSSARRPNLRSKSLHRNLGGKNAKKQYEQLNSNDTEE